MKIEDVLLELKSEMTIVLVTNLVQQAHRLAEPRRFSTTRGWSKWATTKQSSSPRQPANDS